MAWGEWMIPKPGPEHLLTLERQRRAAEQFSEAQAKKMLVQLCELVMRQDLIIRGATRHIAELETKQAFQQPTQTHSTVPAEPAVVLVPWPLRLALRFYGLQLVEPESAPSENGAL